MIKMIITNTTTNEVREYTQEPYTTMRTRMIPYPDECFQVEVGTTLIGSNLGTLIAKDKTGEVFYRNETLGIEALMGNLVCKRVVY